MIEHEPATMHNSILDSVIASIVRPSASDDPFIDEPDEPGAALQLLTHDFCVYALMYKEAGDAVLERALEDVTKRNVLSHPIVFLYRHYIELALKDIAMLGRYLFDEKGSVNLFACHKLDQLWSECKKYIVRAWPDGDNGETAAIEHIILRFARFDPGSYSFRYPATSTGEKIDHDIGFIDLNNLKAVMSGVEAYCFGVSCSFDEWKSNMGGM